MVVISKDESFKIREKFPNAQIVRTMRGNSKRGTYYCVEEKKVMQYLDRLRGN